MLDDVIKVGAKVRHASWCKSGFVEVIDIGTEGFWGVDDEGEKAEWNVCDDWFPYEEPKKTAKFYPLAWQSANGQWHMTSDLFSSQFSVDGFHSFTTKTVWPFIPGVTELPE